MSPQELDAQIATLEAGLADDREQLATTLGMALAFERSPGLCAAITTAAGGGTTAIALSPAGPFLLVEHGRVSGSAMLGQPPAGSDHVIPLPAALALHVNERSGFRTLLRTAEADAGRALAAMRDDAERYSQAAFTELARWAPLLAVQAYRQTLTIQSLFDLERARSIAPPDAECLRRFWERAHLLGHLTMLATSAHPSGWLADMARAFAWRAWTPSFPLVRERVTRLAIRGGWAAARFGVDVIPPYLERLATGKPMHAFDATLGLVAIASAAAVDVRAELAGILGVRSRQPDGALYAALARSADLALEDPEAAARCVTVGSPAALAATLDSDDDPATFDANGHFPAILAMGTLATAPAHLLFARAADAQPRWKPTRASAVLERTRVPVSRWAN